MMADIYLPREAALRYRAAERDRAHSDSRRPDRPRLHRRATPRGSRNCARTSRNTRRSTWRRSTGLGHASDRDRSPCSTGAAKAGFIGWTMGVNHSTQGAETVNAINNLALLTGNIGRAGAAPFSITGQCNAMGTREAGFASGLPGYRKFEIRRGSRGTRRALEHRASAHSAGARPGLPGHHRGGGRQDAFARCGSSPPTRWSPFPITTSCKQALSRPSSSWWCRTDFIPRPPPNWRTWCLPAAMWGEKEGTYTNSERRVSKVNRAVAPPGRSATGFRHLSRPRRHASGCREELFPAGTDRATPSKSGSAYRAGRLCDYSAHDLRTD